MAVRKTLKRTGRKNKRVECFMCGGESQLQISIGARWSNRSCKNTCQTCLPGMVREMMKPLIKVKIIKE